MALTSSEEKRLQRLEKAMGQQATANKNFATKRQLNHIIALLERQLTEVRSENASLQTQIEALKK